MCLVTRLGYYQHQRTHPHENTQDDALDVVEMLQESLLDAFTTEAGEVDFAHHSGSMSLAKQARRFRLLLLFAHTMDVDGHFAGLWTISPLHYTEHPSSSSPPPHQHNFNKTKQHR